MKLEEQVCTLEQAKKLQELGVKKPALFTYVDSSFDKDGSECALLFHRNQQDKGFPAYTVAELVPPYGYVVTPDKVCEDPIFTIWKLGEHLNLDSISGLHKYYKNEAEARADLLIHLIENGIIPTSKPAGK